MPKLNPYHPPKAEINHSQNDGPEGLGGWLILIGSTVALPPVLYVARWILILIGIYTGAFESILDSINWDTQPGRSVLMGVQILKDLIFLPLFIYLTILFFKKSAKFPKFFIGVRVVQFIFVGIDALVIYLITGKPKDGLVVSIILGLVINSLFIAYILKSVRVKNTFVN